MTRSVELLNFFCLQFPYVFLVTAVYSELHLRREDDLGTGHADVSNLKQAKF